ncbi:dihydroxy-acid dehydratase [Bradyrhizobium sp. WSM2793]|uniref:dihydroxy-acid dehydratase domain-containing protein n=1 Tax=Bradyrhizobium sp. WSM2793 TaxID=1038866 RepID=UPI0012FCEED8
MPFSTLLRAKDPTIVSAFETVGASCIGKMTREEFESIEQHSCAGLGGCGARYTANAEDHRSVRR